MSTLRTASTGFVPQPAVRDLQHRRDALVAFAGVLGTLSGSASPARAASCVESCFKACEAVGDADVEGVCKKMCPSECGAPATPAGQEVDMEDSLPRMALDEEKTFAEKWIENSGEAYVDALANAGKKPGFQIDLSGMMAKKKS
eukprot:CAMPEP_0170618176 /NCGR_PEP_ID=MMETSP0224-20130122/26822_1 /TAXON_ID=285029 /ORGANISM="Togula jolla, Strain CCCM 725" /LENGTH=143 /DNA_ID=CAMNT_0010944139 /DNA_START=81 /DNA_END=512 /DNA_ORIENTATION=-